MVLAIFSVASHLTSVNSVLLSIGVIALFINIITLICCIMMAILCVVKYELMESYKGDQYQDEIYNSMKSV